MALQSRINAVDLALANLAVLWPEDATAPARRISTRPTKKLVKARAAKVHLLVAPHNGPGSTSDAADRRARLLELISKSEVGLTIADLRQRTPKMDPKDRQNALSVLKTSGQIKRAGTSWVKTA